MELYQDITEVLAALIVCETQADDRKYYSNRIKSQLFESYQSFRAILQAAIDNQLDAKLNTLLTNQVGHLNYWKAILESYHQQHIQLIVLSSKQYPALLKTTVDAPLLLYTMGNCDLLHQPQIAIVGSRQLTFAGKKNAFEFAKRLSHGGFVITSGMANGVDTQAHLGALHNQANTIAVLGSGLLNPYPKNNSRLMQSIIQQGGLIVSEYKPNTTPLPAYFPARNRIISGLSLGVLVVEASIKSGSLITARLAAEQGREVFAIPGSIHSPVAKGCHQLIRNGAVLIENTEHIVEQLQPMLSLYTDELEQMTQNSTPELKQPLDQKQQKFLDAIGFESYTFDELLTLTKLNASELNIVLTELELTGFIATNAYGYTQI